jgi:hypothetical protein
MYVKDDLQMLFACMLLIVLSFFSMPVSILDIRRANQKNTGVAAYWAHGLLSCG